MCNTKVSEEWANTYIGDGPYTKSSFGVTLEDAIEMYRKGTMLTNDPFQRSWKWSKDRASLLIHSVIFGIPIPVFWANKVDSQTTTKTGKPKDIKIFSLMDGKQRFLAMMRYVEGEYALCDVPPVWDEENESLIDINGCYFKDLPERIQKRILTVSLTINHFDNMTQSQKRELFRRLNNGQPLTAKERNIANCVDLDIITEIGEHAFFRKALTEKAQEQRAQISWIMKAYMILHMDMGDFDYSAKDMAEAMGSVMMTAEEKAEIIAILDKAEQVYDALEGEKKILQRRLATETHFVSLVPFIKRSIDEDISVQRMAGFIKSIFSEKVIVSEDYQDNCRSGSNKTQAIVTRNGILENEYNFYFEGADAEPETIEDSAEATDATADEVTEGETTESENATAGEFRYGMRLRGFAPMCQPMDGLLGREDDQSGKYHDILVYNRELTAAEMADYELDCIG